MKTPILISTAISALFVATPLLAAEATVAIDLNLRAGPGPNYTITGVLPAEATVTVDTCAEALDWCAVTYDGMTGYAYAPYLVVTENDVMVDVPSATVATIETTTYDTSNNGDEALIAGATGAAIAAAAIGGPAAIIAGALLGSTAGAAAGTEVEETTVTYVRQNATQPVFVQGEVVTGATLPAEVELVAIPDTEYSYVNLNGLPVVVTPADRRIVRIVR